MLFMRNAAFATIVTQEAALLEGVEPKSARAQRICFAAYPMLRAVAWGTDPRPSSRQVRHVLCTSATGVTSTTKP